MTMLALQYGKYNDVPPPSTNKHEALCGEIIRGILPTFCRGRRNRYTDDGVVLPVRLWRRDCTVTSPPLFMKPLMRVSGKPRLFQSWREASSSVGYAMADTGWRKLFCGDACEAIILTTKT